jgi:hypothetical protein
MSVYVYRPPFCPRCEVLDLIERHYVVGTVAIVYFSCPRCHWKVVGRDPYVQPIQQPLKSAAVRATYYDEQITLTPEQWEMLDQPNFRTSLSTNGADPLDLEKDASKEPKGNHIQPI